MKISVLAHCSHNKGDNSVLAFLNMKLKDAGVDIHISTSSGKKPFWFIGEPKVSNWGCGLRFPVKNEKFIGKLIRVTRNRIFDRIYYVVLFLFSHNLDKLALYVLEAINDKTFKYNIKDSDSVICTGGHHLSSVLDKDGVNSQLIDMIYAVLCNKKLYLWAQSIGPIETKKIFVLDAIKKLLNRSELICYRDSDSKTFLDNQNVITKKELVDDSVFGLAKTLTFDINDLNKRSGRKRAIIAVYTAGKLKSNTLHNYESILVASVNYLIELGFSVELLPMQYKGLQDDERPFLNAIKKASDKESCVEVLTEDMSPFDTLRYLKGADLLIGHKTHSVVYGLALGIPTIAISYHPKTTFFMSRFDLLDYVIDDKELTSRIVINKIDLALKNSDCITKKIKSRSNEMGDSVINAFGDILL